MRIVKTLKPGQKGTKDLLTRFGPTLLCVRYRYDEDRREHPSARAGRAWSRQVALRILRELPG